MEIGRVLSETEAEAGPLPLGHLPDMLPWIGHHFNGPACDSVQSIIDSLKLRRKHLFDAGGPSSVLESAWVDETLKSLEK